MDKTKIGAIMVLFKPEMSMTMPAIKALAPQVEQLCIVDNTPEQDISNLLKRIPNIHYIPLKENKGIAAAQNIGINHLIELSYQFVIFSDQDSLAPLNIVHTLFEDFQSLKKNNIHVGLIGPLTINKRSKKPYLNKKKIIQRLSLNNYEFIECQSIISSFSLIPLSLFKKVGYYYEDLFIDYVENEWCFRLNNKLHLSAFISTRTSILHELGKSDRFLGKQISISSPFRLYFQIRNFIWLNRVNYVPNNWKRQVRNKIIKKIIYYPIIPYNRVKYLKRILHGILDGFSNKLKYDD